MYTVSFKDGKTYSLEDLDSHGLSYIPFGVVDAKEQPMFSFKHLWGERSQITLGSFGKHSWVMPKMKGIQIFTGKPTYRCVGKTDYIYLTDIDIERKLVDAFPEHLKRIGKTYRAHIQGKPCIVKTKSGGYRLSAFTAYCGKKFSFVKGSDMLLEIFSTHGMSKVDERYSLLEGCLLDIPAMSKEGLQQIYQIASEVGAVKVKQASAKRVSGKSVIGGLTMEWREFTLKSQVIQQSQLFPTQYCRATSHSSNRDEVRFTQYANGAIDGICFNCGERWWEKTIGRIS